jgi:prephenate dehydrogenase
MIGVIGFGRFGCLVVKNLAADFKVVVHDKDATLGKAIQRAGGQSVSMAEACAQKILILCIPISVMQPVLKQVASYLTPGTLVVDVCSVKVLPVQWMQTLLPESIGILATHPMFGPDSASDSLTDHKLVLCPIRIPARKFQVLKQWLSRQGLILLETTPDEHDRQIAVTLALTHFIGRSLSKIDARPMDIDTEGYKRLLHILGVVTNDTWQLFEDMHRYNPYAKQKRQAFIDALVRIHDALNSN